jgi:hypothetical protein
MIYLDMDGVCTNFVGDFLSKFFPNRRYEEVTKYGIHDVLGIPEYEMWSKIDREGEIFWSHMSKYTWTDCLISYFEDFVFLSSPGMLPEAASGKMKWIHRFYGNHFDKWIFTRHKELVGKPGDILVDDSEANCQRWEESGKKAILFPQPWNKNRDIHFSRKTLDYVIDQHKTLTNKDR